MRYMVFLLFIATALSADGFYCAGSFSYDPVMVTGEDVPDGDYFSTAVIAGYEFRGLYAECETVTDVAKASKHQFSPYSTDYYARGGYKYKQIYVEYEHLCRHGVDEYNPRGGHDRFTIGFDTRGKD